MSAIDFLPMPLEEAVLEPQVDTSYLKAKEHHPTSHYPQTMPPRIKGSDDEIAERIEELEASGLAAEVQTAKAFRYELFLRRGMLGRPFDLVSVLHQRDQDRMPVWCLVDPRFRMSVANGGVTGDAGFKCGGETVGHTTETYRFNHFAISSGTTLVPTGIPPVPVPVRKMIQEESSPGIEWLGILCKPLGWRSISPVCPALIYKYVGVETFFVRAIWGPDKPEISEFVF